MWHHSVCGTPNMGSENAGLWYITDMNEKYENTILVNVTNCDFLHQWRSPLIPMTAMVPMDKKVPLVP